MLGNVTEDVCTCYVENVDEDQMIGGNLWNNMYDNLKKLKNLPCARL